MIDPNPQVSQLILQIDSGNLAAANQLLPIVYEELKKLASAKLATESPFHSLSSTDLVHEAFLRLTGKQNFDGCGHFFAAAAEAMRRILVNHARDRNRLKRGGGRKRIELLDQAQAISDDPELVLSVDGLLTQMDESDPTAASVAKLHLFGGLSVDEASIVLGISRASAFRNWKYVRAWLREALEK